MPVISCVHSILSGKKGVSQSLQSGLRTLSSHHPQFLFFTFAPLICTSMDADLTNKQKEATNSNSDSNLFKPISSQPPSPTKSRDSHAANSNSASNRTDPTLPITTSTTERYYQSKQLSMKTGMASSAPGTPQSDNHRTAATSAATGGGASAALVAAFWNERAMPACGPSGGHDDDPGPTLVASGQREGGRREGGPASPLSEQARAAAGAVVAALSGAGGLCGKAPPPWPSVGRSAPAAKMEGIPEEGDDGVDDFCGVHADGNFCGGDGDCFEFEEFGFNAFRDDGGRGDAVDDAAPAASPPPPAGEGATPSTTPPERQQPKGYEIRLKSTFSQAKAQKEQQRERRLREPAAGRTTPPAHVGAALGASGAFGRTHPNGRKSPGIGDPPAADDGRRRASDEDDGAGDGDPPDGLPFRELSVPTGIDRSVSELTMRSHGAFERHRHGTAGGGTAGGAFDSRRMAYYAVGKAGGGSGGTAGGGNRRCYFTGDAVPHGAPFYAGSVRQGPRTLVVFCLPWALGLPRADGADREGYLDSLPAPDAELLEGMRRRYPGPFDTLPVQVRSPHCWRLFVKFCFFSGLPIAEGEMHYRVRGSTEGKRTTAFPTSSSSSSRSHGEGIALSHEVMEAVNGEVSAEMLRLPNQNLFDYLKRQYSQQSSKLSDEVFLRSSWEMVRPEV